MSMTTNLPKLTMDDLGLGQYECYTDYAIDVIDLLKSDGYSTKYIADYLDISEEWVKRILVAKC